MAIESLVNAQTISIAISVAALTVSIFVYFDNRKNRKIDKHDEFLRTKSELKIEMVEISILMSDMEAVARAYIDMNDRLKSDTNEPDTGGVLWISVQDLKKAVNKQKGEFDKSNKYSSISDLEKERAAIYELKVMLRKKFDSINASYEEHKKILEDNSINPAY